MDSLGHGIKDFDATNLVKINTSVTSDTEVANLEVPSVEQKPIKTSTENPQCDNTLAGSGPDVSTVSFSELPVMR